ncbi:MAG: HD domain-containing protein [Azospirillum sp.]|nr:HD domain-containing protein [Azospirillum sp.]
MAGEAVEVLSGFWGRLVRRLLTVGALVSIIAGIAAFAIETHRLDDSLVDQAALEARTLAGLLGGGGGAELNDRTLNEFLNTHAVTRRDFFVLAELYDGTRKSVGEAALTDYTFVEAHFDRSGHRFPALGEAWYTKTTIAEAPYLQVMVPLDGSDGQLRGWFEGIYRLSPKTRYEIRIGILQSIGLAVGAVLLTAAVLYPLMSSLQGRIVATALDLLRANIDTLKVLGSAIAKRDSDTNLHNFRVVVYAVRIAEAIGLDDAAIRSLIKGAFLHDVGKIAVRDAILLKPGKLDAAEYAEMKTHVAHGLDIIAASAWLEDAAEVVGGHHERVDGAGYPRGLAGNAVPLAARIFAVADVYDALTSARPYKTPMPADVALGIMEQGRDRHLDGPILDAFRGILPRLQEELAGRRDREVEAVAEGLLTRYFQL